MKLQAFSTATLDAQIKNILTNGHFVAYQINGVYAVNLFQLNDFYVETYFHLPTLNFQWVNCFDCNGKQLLPYLQKIKIKLPAFVQK